MNNKKVILFVSHVLPGSPRAGNELRINRLVEDLNSSGYSVHFVYTPHDRTPIVLDQVRATKKLVDRFYLVNKWKMKAAHPKYRQLLNEKEQDIPLSLRSIQDIFCCPKVLSGLEPILDKLNPAIVVSEYIFFSRIFFISPPTALRVIDLHDLFSTKIDKVIKFGIKDPLAITQSEERALVDRSDLAVAIQNEEAKKLKKMKVKAKTIVIGVYPNVTRQLRPPARSHMNPVFLLVASDNVLNKKGIEGFLTHCWSEVCVRVPNVKLHIVGNVRVDSKILDQAVGVVRMGYQKSLERQYAKSDVVINPVYAGTGLKIKTIEALFQRKPLISWPAGVDGLEMFSRHRAWAVAADWDSFTAQVIKFANNVELRKKMSKKAERFLKDYVSYMKKRSFPAELARMRREQK